MESKPVAFQFTKAVKKSAVIPTPLNSSEKTEEVDFVKSVDDHGIESSKKRKEYAPLIIPLKKPRLKPAQTSDAEQSSAEFTTLEKSLDAVAAEEILQETAEGVDTLAKEKELADIEVSSSTITQGAVIGEVPTLDDYDSVPVEEFGKALLRGMGWKDGDGTGKKGEVVGQFEAVVRPKGLGLGATVVASQSAAPAGDGEEELRMAPGAYVLVTIGKEKGNYGQVLSLDGDGRALLKMAVSGSTSSLPEGTLQLVSKKDYKRNSRVINQDKYTEYKELQDRGRGSAGDRAGPDRGSRPSGERDSRPAGHRDRGAAGRERAHRRPREDGHSAARSPARSPPAGQRRPWVRPHIRVRCIDQKYKKGRYYKEKLTVVDVITAELCVCEDASGRLLEDVSTSRLETVVPRKQPGVVMVVRGPHAGQVGEVVGRDQKRYRATLQLLPDRQLASLDYDDICEYTGSMEAYC